MLEVMNKKLEALLERASTWPEEAQAELMQTIVDIETKHFGVYQLDESERAAVQRGLKRNARWRVSHGRGSHESVQAAIAHEGTLHTHSIVRDRSRYCPTLQNAASAPPPGSANVSNEPIEGLALVPEMAQLTDEPGVRRLPVRSYPYVIFYTIEGDEVVILHVRHGCAAIAMAIEPIMSHGNNEPGSRSVPTRRPTRMRRSNCGAAPGSSITRRSISTTGWRGGVHAGATNWWRPRPSRWPKRADAWSGS